jgi:predicted RNase H-like HicB family nuclease
MANTTGSGKRPIFMLSTQGKSREQLKAEAREALRKYQEAQQQEK